MNTQKSSLTPYIIIAIVVGVFSAGYFYWNGSQPTEGTTLSETNGLPGQEVGTRVFQLLGEIKSLKIDTTFFEDSSYLTLRDYTVSIPQLPIGRPNPFAPLPGVANPAGSSSTH